MKELRHPAPRLTFFQVRDSASPPVPCPWRKIFKILISKNVVMARLLLMVPKMFTKTDLEHMDYEIPADFQEKSAEYWNYVKERLRSIPKVDKVYYDSLTDEDESAALDFVKRDNEECYSIVCELQKDGAKLQSTEDKISVSETQAWAEQAERAMEGDTSAFELLAQSLEERNKKVTDRISKNLAEGETAVFFVSPSRKLASFFEGSGVRAITIQPFDPIDYVTSWLTTLRIKRKANSSN
jgi:uncharacterized protein YukE